MNKYHAIWFVLLMACGGETSDTAGEDGSTELAADYFNGDLELESLGDSFTGTVAFFPEAVRDVHAYVVAFDAPEPPYQIKALGVSVLTGSGASGYRCSAAVPVELVAWVEEDATRDPTGYNALDANNIPQLPVLASGMASGLSPDDLLEGEDDRIEVVTAQLESPVRVSTAGKLFVAVKIQPKPEDVPDELDDATCILQYGYDGPETTWIHEGGGSTIPSWGVHDRRADFRVTLAVHTEE